MLTESKCHLIGSKKVMNTDCDTFQMIVKQRTEKMFNLIEMKSLCVSLCRCMYQIQYQFSVFLTFRTFSALCERTLIFGLFIM